MNHLKIVATIKVPTLVLLLNDLLSIAAKIPDNSWSHTDKTGIPL